MLRVGAGHALGLGLPLGQGLGRDLELHGREGLHKRSDHTRIDGIGRPRVTHGGPRRLPEVVTEGAGAPLLRHDHLGAACPAGDEAVHEGCARPWEAAGVVPVLRGVLVCAHRLPLERRVPTARGRRDIREADAPLLLRQTGDRGAHLARLAAPRAGTAGGQRPRRGRRREHREHGRHPGSLPDQSAAAIPSGQHQRVCLAHVDHFPGRATRHKRLAHPRQAGVGFLVGERVPRALAGADQARGPWQGPCAALGLVEEPGGEAGLPGVPRPCRPGPFPTSEASAVDRGGSIHAIAIGHPAALVAPHVPERRPVCAVA
jgi:hypothetical protein